MMARKEGKHPLGAKDFMFILGNAFHCMMVEMASVRRSRRRPLLSPEELAHHFLRAAIHRQSGRSAGQVSCPSPWTFNKAHAWLVYYANATLKLMDKHGLSPLLMEQALSPYPLCKERGLYEDTCPDLIARRVVTSTLGVYDYKTVSSNQYQAYCKMLASPDLAEQVNSLDLMTRYGAAAEHDIHNVNEPIAEVGLIVVPRRPLTPTPRPVLLVAAPFDRSQIAAWRNRRMKKILGADYDCDET